MKFCDVIDNLQADIVCFNKHRINISHAQVKNGPWQLFGQEAAISTIKGHNVHKNIGRIQEGGTMMLAIDEINQFYRPADSDKDPTGLGGWVSMAFLGHGGYTTQVVIAYNPCYNNRTNSRTTYQQHR